MRKVFALSVLISLVSTLLPVSANADYFTDTDEVVIYEDKADLYPLSEIDEFSLYEADESAMEIVSISSVNDLIDLRNNINSDADYSKEKIFRLTNNIDLGGIEWEPIGYNDSYQIGDDLNKLRDYSFRGIFDGQGYTISNFKMTNSDLNYLGFFGTIHLGTVRNLKITDANIDYVGTSTKQIPQFSGLLTAFSNYATISDCTVSGTISIKNTDSYISGITACAGLVTGVGLAQIDNCRVSGSIDINTLVPVYAGGLWGYASTAGAEFDSHIYNCSSDVSIDTQSISGISSGGIIGRGSDSVYAITDCSYSSKGTSDIAATHSYSTENLGSASVFLGGIAGVNSSEVKNCTVGEIKISAEAQSSPTIGGIAGRNESVIDNCTTEADISIKLTRSSLKSAASATAGGIAGTNGANYDNSADPAPATYLPQIKNCNITTDVSISINSESALASVCGFIAGLTYAPAEIINCGSESSDMSINSKNASTYAGSICGLLNGGAARYCVATGAIGENISSATSTYIGGIAGDANLKYFYTYDPSFGHISPLFTVAYFYGATIEDCLSDVDITAKNSSRVYAGGICGYQTNNYTENDETYYITATRKIAISRCVSNGDITVTPGSNTFTGGCVGYSIDGKIYNSYSTGTITVTKDASSAYIGGFIGAIYQNRHDYDGVTASLDNCYTISEITVPEKASSLTTGAFSGFIVKSPVTEISPKLTSCYYLSGTSQVETEGLAALDSASMSNTDSFSGWDFSDIWYMSGEKPILSYEKTRVIDYTSEQNTVANLTISTPAKNFYVYAVTYSGDIITDTRVYSGNQANCSSAFVYDITCNIPVSIDTVTKIYIWSNSQKPLCDVYTI